MYIQYFKYRCDWVFPLYFLIIISLGSKILDNLAERENQSSDHINHLITHIQKHSHRPQEHCEFTAWTRMDIDTAHGDIGDQIFADV